MLGRGFAFLVLTLDFAGTVCYYKKSGFRVGSLYC